VIFLLARHAVARPPLVISRPLPEVDKRVRGDSPRAALTQSTVFFRLMPGTRPRERQPAPERVGRALASLLARHRPCRDCIAGLSAVMPYVSIS